MDGGDESGWSAVASTWADLWGGFAGPSRDAVISATGIGPGARVLDVGCGSGEFLAKLERIGLLASGIDPAVGMVEIARAVAPSADVRLGGVESLPWPDASFDVVTAFNVLQFAEDTLESLSEMVRVTVPGGFIAIVDWAERQRNDLDAIDAVLAAAAGDDPALDGDLRVPGGLEQLLADAGLAVVSADLVETPWEAPDDETLVRGVLLGEGVDVVEESGPIVLAAAQPFRTSAGGYRLSNAFRVAIGRRQG